MPQYYKDAFAKEHARIIGEGLGEFDNNLSISTETLDFDVLFMPNAKFLAQSDRDLDLYCRLLKTDSVVNLEFFSGALRPENLRECRIRTNLDWVKQKNNYDSLMKKIRAIKDGSETKNLAAKLTEPKLKFCWIKEALVETIRLPLDHPKRNAIIDLGRSYYDFLFEQPELQLSNEDTIDMRTLSEIYQANRAQSIALEQALAEAQRQVAEAQRQADQAQPKIVKNFLTRKFGDKVLTDEVTARLEQLSSEQLDDLLFQAASWNSPTQIQNYFNPGSV